MIVICIRTKNIDETMHGLLKKRRKKKTMYGLHFALQVARPPLLSLRLVMQ